jgi:uncharacterized membrane protein YeaQ/YmgE (transglycosylase-associated protein family)
MVNVLVWLFIGAVMGGIASYWVSQREGLLLNVAVGIAGAFIIGYGLGPLLELTAIGQSSFSLAALVISLLSAVFLLAAVSIFHRGRLRLR